MREREGEGTEVYNPYRIPLYHIPLFLTKSQHNRPLSSTYVKLQELGRLQPDMLVYTYWGLVGKGTSRIGAM